MNQAIASNPTLETIFRRKSVRKYRPGGVNSETLSLLVRAGMAAPSAKNLQPWKFVIVTDEGLKAEMAEKLPYAKMLAQAPAAIVVCGDLKKSSGSPCEAYWVQDCSAATQNILLAAESLGLGAVWTAAHPYPDRVKIVVAALALPSNLIPLCVIPLGYPEKEEAGKNKWNADNLLWNRGTPQ